MATRQVMGFVVEVYNSPKRCGFVGPFATKDEARTWIDESGYGLLTIHQLLSPGTKP